MKGKYFSGSAMQKGSATGHYFYLGCSKFLTKDRNALVLLNIIVFVRVTAFAAYKDFVIMFTILGYGLDIFLWLRMGSSGESL